MGVNPGSLQRDISTNAHHFTADLIGDFERVEVQIDGMAPYTISSSSDTFDDLLPGVDVTLTGVPDDMVTIDVTKDSSGIADRIDAPARALSGGEQ